MSGSLPTATKKRKRDTADDGAGDKNKISFKMASRPANELGAVLVSFPALQPPAETAFQCYTQKNSKKSQEGQDFASQSIIVAGEADTVEFHGRNQMAESSNGCRYLVAVHNKRTKTTTLRPAPLNILAREVKALKNLQPAAVSTAQRVEARNALGETFGTKKAKAAIRAQERNKMDISAMERVAGHLQDRIDTNTGSLPTTEEAKATADSNRLIPAYDPDAETPDEAYPLHNIIPEPEWNALSVSALTSAPSDRDRIALLPYTRSNWVNQRLRQLFAESRVNKSNLKILFYISSMFAFRNATHRSVDKQALQEKLTRIPTIVLDGLLSRFTETSRDSKKMQKTSATETSLLTFMFALCLRIDDYATDTTLIAADLSMAVPQVNNLFKTLGCKIEKLSMQELGRLGLPSSAAETKRAVLKVPLQFPKPRAKRRG